MRFTSVSFLLYFLPASLLLYWVCWFSIPIQNLCLLTASLLFYSWGAPVFLVPLAFLVVVNHFFGMLLGRTPDKRRRKRLVALATTLNFATLLLVRYGDAVAPALAAHTGFALPRMGHPTLFGISFFTLQACTYIFEISRGKRRPEANPINTGLFIAFMPTVLAGPVLSFKDLAPQLHKRSITLESFGDGCARFVVGLAKQLVLTLPLFHLTNNVFNLTAAVDPRYSVSVTSAWLGLFAFGLQFYLLLSGYSDMAVGLAGMFGFGIKGNFDNPHGAHSVTEFWNRWLVSVYRWFYVYVFMALGGARAKITRVRGKFTRPRNFVVRNMFVMWMLIGLWHGISWNHLAFGFWFFIFSLFEWLISLRRLKAGGIGWRVYTLTVVGIGWILVRSHSLDESMRYFSNLFGISGNALINDFTLVLLRENWLFLLAGLIAAAPLGQSLLGRLRTGGSGMAGAFLGLCHFLFILALLCLCCVFLGEGAPFSFYILN